MLVYIFRKTRFAGNTIHSLGTINSIVLIDENMKRKKVLFICISAFLCLLAFCVIGALILRSDGAGMDEGVLPSPDGLKVEDYWLSWNKVDGAKEYIIDINGQEYHATQNKLDVFAITYSSQNTIKVMALGNFKENFDSEWSEPLQYSVEISAFAYRMADNDEVCEISGFYSEEIKGKLIIPETIDGKPVRVVGGAFKNCDNLTDVIFLGAETEVGEYAFINCDNLKRVMLPAWMTEIPLGMFESCDNLSTIEIPEYVTTIGARAFYGCTAIKNIVLPNGLVELERGCFTSCNALKQIILPESVVKINDRTFLMSALESIRIPKNVENIGKEVFAFCDSLTSIIVDENNSVYKSEQNCIIRKSDDTLIGTCAASVIPNTVKTIGERAFCGVSISKITLPEGVIRIERDAFGNNYNLSEINLPSTVVEIQMPQGLSDVHEITVDKDNPIFRSENNCIIRKSDNALILGSVQSTIPDSVKIIADHAFQGTKITKIEIPPSVEVIAQEAFSRCVNLESINFSEGLLKIGQSAFCGCGALAPVVIPKTVKEIGSCAFMDCVAIFILPSSVESIGNGAFGASEIDYANTLPPSIIFTSAPTYVKDGWADAEYMGNTLMASSWRANTQCICSCDFGYDGKIPYVKSFLFVKNFDGDYENVTITIAKNSFYAPFRSGYKFIGWATDEKGDNVVSRAYTSMRTDGVETVFTLSREDRRTIPDGTVLYAVWEKE